MNSIGDSGRFEWQSEPMLCRAYIEALLANEANADRIWDAWQAGDLDEEVAYIAWILVAGFGCQRPESSARAFVGLGS